MKIEGNKPFTYRPPTKYVRSADSGGCCLTLAIDVSKK